MRCIVISIFIILFSVGSSFAQKELTGFLRADKSVLLDTLSYDNSWEIYERKVTIKCILGYTPLLTITLTNYQTDSAYVLGKAIVESLETNTKTMYMWDPTSGTYYISKVDYLGQHGETLKGYVNFRDESIRSFNDFTKQPALEKEYFQGEERLDLSIVKTFPKYFKELYEEKYGAINEP